MMAPKHAAVRCSGAAAAATAMLALCLMAAMLLVAALSSAMHLVPHVVGADNSGSLYRPPSSFSTMATSESLRDATLLLYSLSKQHPGAHVFVSCDSNAAGALARLVAGWPGALQVTFVPTLDKYSGMNRGEMEASGAWLDLQMEKANIMDYALRLAPDTLFLDSDFVLLAPIQIPVDAASGAASVERNNRVLGLSPHYIDRHTSSMFGEYNGGMIWAASPAVTAAWREFAKTSRFYDQAALEGVAASFPHFSFGLDYNYSWWRFQSDALSDAQKLLSLAPDRSLAIDGKTLRCFHTHLFGADRDYVAFNQYMIRALAQSGRYEDLLGMMLDHHASGM